MNMNMYYVRGITAILAGIVLLALSGTPTITAEADQRQESITVLYSGEEKAQPDFNVVDWFPGTNGQQIIEIVNDGTDTKAVINAGKMSDSSMAYDTDVILSLISGDILYVGKYSDMDATVFIPEGRILTLNLEVQWNPSLEADTTTPLEALGLQIATL